MTFFFPEKVIHTKYKPHLLIYHVLLHIYCLFQQCERLVEKSSAVSRFCEDVIVYAKK
jgi:hypothetical protein